MSNWQCSFRTFEGVESWDEVQLGAVLFNGDWAGELAERQRLRIRSGGETIWIHDPLRGSGSYTPYHKVKVWTADVEEILCWKPSRPCEEPLYVLIAKQENATKILNLDLKEGSLHASSLSGESFVVEKAAKGSMKVFEMLLRVLRLVDKQRTEKVPKIPSCYLKCIARGEVLGEKLWMKCLTDIWPELPNSDLEDLEADEVQKNPVPKPQARRGMKRPARR